MNRANATSKHRWGILAILFVLVVLNATDKSAIGLAAVPIMREMNLSHAEFGRISSSFFLLFSISTAIVGIISTRVKTRWILTVLVLLWSVSQLPILFYATPHALLASRIMLGAGEGPAFIMCIHALYKWFPEKDRMLPTTVLAAGMPLTPVVTWLIIAYGWRAAFLTLAVVGVVWVIVWLGVGHEGPLAVEPKRNSAAEPDSKDPAPGLDHVPYWRMLTSRTCLGVILCGFCAYITYSIAVVWMPAYLEQVDGYSMRVTGFILMMPPVLSIVACPALGWWSQHMQRRGISTRYTRGVMNGGVVAVTGLTVLLIPIVRTEWFNLTMIAIAFSITFFTYSAGVATISEISPTRQRGAMLGISGAIQTTAGLLSPVAMGYIIDMSSSAAAGYKLGLMIVGAVALCGGALGAILINPARDRLYFLNAVRRASTPLNAAANDVTVSN
ncbi:Sugar phosphate permease [Burkholderia sp. D7]|nr:Sugar phosphate permease [Burkholderia sp. D7]